MDRPRLAPSSLAAVAALLLAAPGAAAERLAVVAVHDPGPTDADLSELTHQLRAACTERVGGVLPAPASRARISGGPTLAELDRAFGGALAVYQNGEFESAVRTLRAIVEDLEELPEGEEAWRQWTRAMMRLSHAAATVGNAEESEAVQLRLLAIDPTFQLDPVQYAPGYRARFEELRRRVQSLPRRRLTVTARGRAGTIYLGGRNMGSTPATLMVPAGSYRVGGAAGSLRVPSFGVDLGAEDRAVVLDFALAEAVRPNAGPGLSLAPAERAGALVRAGAWLGADRLVAVSRSDEGGARFLVGSLIDARRGALLREGSVRMVSGGVPAASLAALAGFLISGQSSREVLDRTREPTAARGAGRPSGARAPAAAATATAVAGPPPAPPQASSSAGADGPGAPSQASAAPATARPPSPPAAPEAVAAAALAAPAAPSPGADQAGPPPATSAPDLHASEPAAGTAPPPRDRRAWMRPASIGAAVLSVALGGLALQQALRSRSAYDDAAGMVGPGGVLLPGSDPARYNELVAQGDSARRTARIAGGTAAATAGVAGVLWWLSRPEPPPG